MQAKSVAHSRFSNHVSSCPQDRTGSARGRLLPHPSLRGACLRLLLKFLRFLGDDEPLLPS